MVHETLDIAAQILDFNLDTLTQHAQLQRSSSGSCCTENCALQQQSEPQQQQQQPHPQAEQSGQQQPARDLLSVSLHTQLPPKSAENLSWKFFEQVSTLDNQLRLGEESSVIRANGGHSIDDDAKTTAPASTYGATVPADGQHQETIVRQSNGYVSNFASNTCDDILSQLSPDLIQTKSEQLQPQQSTFRFTSPTSTFKRKKKQQQQQQQQVYHQSQNNNNTHSNNNQSNTTLKAAPLTTTTTTTTPLINNQLQIPTPAAITQRPVSVNLPATSPTPTPIPPTTAKQHNATLPPMMLSGTGANNSTTAAATATPAAGSIIGIGLGSTRAPLKTRALPAITTAPATVAAPTPRQAYAGDSVDLVGGHTKATTAGGAGAVTEKHLATLQPHRMGAQLTGCGGGVGGGAGGPISGNHSNSSGNSNNNNNHKDHCTFIDGIETHLALIGWRKKCLYTLLLLLMLLIITNLVLTLWILKVMEFSTEGMGQLKIVPGGIELSGQALIMDMLRASTIRSRHGQPIAIESSRNFSINTRDTNGLLENHLFLGHDKLECLSTGFRINDTAGRNLFSVNRNEVTIGAHALRIDGEGGAIFRESIQTPHVRAEPGRELRLESPTRQLELTAARDINLQSRAGGIELSALGDVKLSALDGSLRLESAKILMPNLRTAQPPTLGAPQSRDHLHRVFQLCACSNGKLFLAAPHSICAGDDSTVCR